MKFIPLLILIGTTPLIIQTSATAAQAASRQTTASPAASPTPASTPKRPARIRVRRAIRVATPTPTPTATPPPAPKAVQARRAAPKATPAPEPEEEAKETGRPGFFSRIFSIGGFQERQREPEPTPEPTPEATPTPAKAAPSQPAQRSSTPPPPTPQEHEEVYATQLPSIQTGTAYQSGLPPFQAAAASTPVSTPAAPSTPTAAATPGDLSEEPVVAALPTPPPNPELDRERYLKVKKEAAAVPEIAELGKKVNAASPGEEQQKLAREYTKALFKKMTSIDSSQLEWFQRLEAATLRRIDAGKPFVAE